MKTNLDQISVPPHAPIPHGLRVPEEEEACVRKWDIAALKDSAKKQNVAATPTPSTTPFTNNATINNSSSSSSSSSHSTRHTTSHTPTMSPSESEATTEGDCRTRPLKSTGKRAKDCKWQDALLEATQKRARPTSDVSSEEEDYFDRPPDQRY